MNTTPVAYGGFDRMPIGDNWRAGSSGRELADTDPWSGAVLTRIPLASAADVEAAYAAAEATQPGWAAMLPAERAAVMLRAKFASHPLQRSAGQGRSPPGVRHRDEPQGRGQPVPALRHRLRHRRTAVRQARRARRRSHYAAQVLCASVNHAG